MGMDEIGTVTFVPEIPESAKLKRQMDYRELYDVLRDRQGVWARLQEFPDQKEARSLVMKLRQPGYKFAWRHVEADKWAVFGKFEGFDGTRDPANVSANGEALLQGT